MKEERRFKTKVMAAVVAVVFLIILGTVVYHTIEGWSYLDSAYFTTITLTTIGYGDLAPTHATSKIFTMFFVFSGVGIFLFAMTVIAEHYFKRRIGMLEKTVRKVGTQAQKAVNYISHTEEPQKVTRRDYVKGMEITPKKFGLPVKKQKKRK